MFRTLTVTLALLCLVGCNSGPKVLPASAHDPLPKEKVKIYQVIPLQYEMLGTLVEPMGPDVKWDERGDATAGFDKILTAAGKMGANGVLLEADPGQADVTVGAGYKGTFYRVPLKTNPRAAVVKAIYVHKE